MDTFEIKNGKKLRCGYTTGSCAAAAAKAAATMILTGQPVCAVRLATPKGIVLQLDIEDCRCQPDVVTCAVRKDAGDDPDITDGLRIYATVEKIGQGVDIDGGSGVGRVTKEGLACAVGEAAINPTPRRMIRETVLAVAQEYGYTGGFKVTISIPGGAGLACKTFNPRLGIVGGLSVLGTSGIVDPMSEQALIDTIHVEMNARQAAGEQHLLAFFGNYGVDFSRDILHADVSKRITFSNYIGEMLDYAVYCGFTDVLVIGHIGKLVKVAQGIMNTHSRYADGRTTLLALDAVFSGAAPATARAIYDSITTDEAVRILQKNSLLEPVMAQICDKIDYYMKQRAGDTIRTGAIIFSNTYGVLGYTGQAQALLALHQQEEKSI
jgi:cobalt-precorrin-5B (C1)-methyltransferase